MVIAALVSFGLLFAAWVVAPEKPVTRVERPDASEAVTREAQALAA
jgi:hypothetical protein